MGCQMLQMRAEAAARRASSVPLWTSDFLSTDTVGRHELSTTWRFLRSEQVLHGGDVRRASHCLPCNCLEMCSQAGLSAMSVTVGCSRSSMAA